MSDWEFFNHFWENIGHFCIGNGAEIRPPKRTWKIRGPTYDRDISRSLLLYIHYKIEFQDLSVQYLHVHLYYSFVCDEVWEKEAYTPHREIYSVQSFGIFKFNEIKVYEKRLVRRNFIGKHIFFHFHQNINAINTFDKINMWPAAFYFPIKTKNCTSVLNWNTSVSHAFSR